MEKDKFLLLFTLVALLLRFLVSVNSYSGAGKPPMFGDYEAQRHWMEITINLPLRDWYMNTTENDLLYWGLDYPPLTAYGSAICGEIGRKIEPNFMELFKSRGYETPSSKLFMRMTVIVSDLLVLFPASYLFSRTFNSKVPNALLCYLFLLIQPALLIIDHGHFQYNGVSLGFTIFAVHFLFTNRDLLASFFFVLSLNYKQMSLYHSTAFFFYLLGKNWNKKENLKSLFRIITIGIVVIFTFIIIWLPFLLNGSEVTLQVLKRLFPMDRGLYEDKVSNIWCAISPFIKLKNWFSVSTLATISLFTTLLALLPSGIHLMLNPSKENFLLGMANASLAFFLFSFQVHEKSILLPLLPISMMVIQRPKLSFWFTLVSMFSMYPLLHKDGLMLPYFVFFVVVSVWMIYLLLNAKKILKIAFSITLIGMILLHALHAFYTPPARFPDILILSFAMFSFIHLFSFFLYLHWVQIFQIPRIKTE